MGLDAINTLVDHLDNMFPQSFELAFYDGEVARIESTNMTEMKVWYDGAYQADLMGVETDTYTSLRRFLDIIRPGPLNYMSAHVEWKKLPVDVSDEHVLVITTYDDIRLEKTRFVNDCRAYATYESDHQLFGAVKEFHEHFEESSADG